uniref:Rapid alkalinization factor-like n=1 Tax=Nelumbo nucifera TaxID=4432 RepID=A0A822XJG5_NELNU|nr:TPA_asm: hypothetical protein HUJ06_020764 [Nelumbo nucifera]
MATSSRFFVMIVVFIMALLILSFTTVDASGEYQLGWLPTKPTCQGSREKCMAGGNELKMDSEINHCILATSQYINYGALYASYYNCKPRAQANPYNCGCSAIIRCRS